MKIAWISWVTSKAYLLLSSLIVTVLCIYGVAMYMHGRSYFTHRLITSHVQIASEWQEIDPKGQIESIADSNFITIDLEDPFVMEYGDKKLTAPGVEGFQPEIKVVDGDGVEYFFVMAGSTGKNRIRYRYTENRKLPTGKTYTKLFIRSDVPFAARNIFFTYYYVKDMG